MNAIQISKKGKGGRPVKPVKQNQFIGVKCSLIEKKLIQLNAKAVGLSMSEYLRELGLKGQADRKIKVLPKEVLLFTATLNHMAANINQVAKKRNQHDELSVIERAGLTVLSNDIKRLAADIKNFLQ
ncbi:plasmid mobilization protein [Terrimonas pollutisoli]|uniref:plasmid mobilization protein n=1 Tax=Terrimonas pollutisoli TaxID=3034147 RepID=UPI003F6D198B